MKIFGKRDIKISAQVRAMGFYEKFDFRQVSKPYDDGGIKHVDMVIEK